MDGNKMISTYYNSHSIKDCISIICISRRGIAIYGSVTSFSNSLTDGFDNHPTGITV